jgi:hypothetical protein
MPWIDSLAVAEFAQIQAAFESEFSANSATGNDVAFSNDRRFSLGYFVAA